MAQIQQKLLAALPPRLRELLVSNSRRELLKQVQDVLLLHGDNLYQLATGTQRQISNSSDAGAIASAAGQLLGEVGDDHGLLLLLPPQEFVASNLHMPGITPDTLESALALQVESLLPAFEEPLALAVNPASAETGEDHIALWLDQQRLDTLFESFEQQGLFLAAVRPRVLAASGNEVETRLLDLDSDATTAVAISDGIIRQWLNVDSLDLEDDVFKDQFEQELKSHPTGQSLEFETAQDYLQHFDPVAAAPYSFIPAGALRTRKKDERKQKLIAAAGLVVFLGMLSAVPFLLQSLEFRSAASALATNRNSASEARADQSVVVEFENEWGAINDFPRQDIAEVMFTLQEALLPDQLSSLEISEGLISIQGTSEEPQAILQRLEQSPLFTEVVFARATNNARYYIDLRLSPVNFEGYMRRYFPDE